MTNNFIRLLFFTFCFLVGLVIVIDLALTIIIKIFNKIK